MDGHEADLWGAAFHPQDPGIFATVCDDRTMLLWSAAQRRVILSSDLGFRGR